jgi:hypothetical protein
MANKALKLRQYELDDSDWDILEDLLQVLKACILPCHNMNDNSHWQWLLLQMYKDATLFFSQDSVVTIANIVPTAGGTDKQREQMQWGGGGASHFLCSYLCLFN